MIEILYKCHCMDKEAKVEVTPRPEGADILVWMELVQMTIGMHHRAACPTCTATSLEYAKIPYNEDDPGIGMEKTKQ